MRLNAIGGLDFGVTARVDNTDHSRCALLQLRIGALVFNMTEGEALRLANRIADAVEQHRRAREVRQ